MSRNKISFRRGNAVIRALSDAGRCVILQHLSEHGATNVTDLVTILNDKGLGATQPNVSHHLRILLGADLVENLRFGKNVEYALADSDNSRFAVSIINGMEPIEVKRAKPARKAPKPVKARARKSKPEPEPVNA